MKKVLLGTSAIALAGAYASAANAAEWNVRVGGYMEQYIAYASSDVDNVVGEDHDGVDSKQDAEIAFVPSITLDNGIQFGANVQLEANTTGDQIDESYMFIRGSFGEVNLGSENSARYKMQYAAPDVTFINVNSGSTTAFIPYSGTAGGGAGSSGAVNVGDDVFRGTLGSTFIENLRNNDAQRFTYYSPRFAGFQVGVSYARDGNQDSNGQLDLSGEVPEHFVDVGANYVNSFGDFDIAIAGGYGIVFQDDNDFDDVDDLGDIEDEFADDPQVWNAGANIGFAGVTIGGSFAEQNNAGADDGVSWDAGISYETGPWGVSFTYFKGENVDDENAFGVFEAVDTDGDGTDDDLNFLGNDEELKQYLLGVNYKLAQGVDLGAFGAYIDFEEDVGDAGGNGDDVDGFIIGTGVKISF